jgi:outer membrane receptor protein involved in Fe transport
LKNKMMRIKYLLTLIILLLQFSILNAQTNITISGIVKDKYSKANLPFVNVILKTEKDSNFVCGTITNEEGRFLLSKIKSGNYYIEVSYIGYKTIMQSLFVGNLTDYLDIKNIELEEKLTILQEVVVTGKTADISEKMDKKTFSLNDNISQSGGSVLQAIQNLPSVTVQEGKVQLRGNDKVTVLIDGKQTALTGFGNQTGLDNIPASAIEKIEIINNPSAKFDANGNAGIINIIYKKNKQEGFNGKIGFTTGLGSLWVREENLPSIRPQYTFTPKINPSVSLNYRKNKVNVFFQCDYLYTETLNKNEFVTRNYDNGEVINSQLKRNRNTHFTTLKSGIDYTINDQNSMTISGLFGSEKIIDRGDQPFFNGDLSQRKRLWQFLEDELKTTVMATANYQHKFKEAGHLLNVGFNYTFHREDEKYFYDNYLPTSTGTDAFKLLSDEQVYDFNFDYIKPLKYGRIETGIKLRNRNIPTNMQFIPGANSVLDTNAGGWATYKELIPAVYGNYIFENKKWEAELGLRIEYVKIQYDVNPNHIVYKSDGYNYTQPFPNLRLAYKINEHNKISLFFNRRVDRPNEVDIRIFPKYDDAEIIKVGNPALRPQFTNSIELGYKTSWNKGYFYSAAYHRFADGTINRISSITLNSNLIYAIFQNAGRSYNTGLEVVLSQEVANWYSFNLNLNGYHNQINAFSIENKYPALNTFSADKQEIISGNIKMNNTFHFPKNTDAQLTAIYLAPDIIPQGKIKSRFSIDLGIKKAIQKGKGELFFNATDLLNTMIIKKEINGQGFNYTSNDYYETQVIRLGYSYKF